MAFISPSWTVIHIHSDALRKQLDVSLDIAERMKASFGVSFGSSKVVVVEQLRPLELFDGT